MQLKITNLAGFGMALMALDSNYGGAPSVLAKAGEGDIFGAIQQVFMNSTRLLSHKGTFQEFVKQMIQLGFVKWVVDAANLQRSFTFGGFTIGV